MQNRGCGNGLKIPSCNYTMKVAVCISGQPRRALETFPYIKKFIIEPNDADVFIHMHFDKNALYMEKSHADNGHCALEPDIDMRVLQAYNPVRYLVEPPRNFSRPLLNVSDKRLNNFIEMNKHKEWTRQQHKEHMIKQMTSMYYSIYKCNELKEVYANENRIVYDYVIRLRFDSLPRAPLVCSQYDPNFIYYQEIGQGDNLISDWINFGSNAIMNVYASLYLMMEYLNTFQFYKHSERLPNTVEPSTTCGGLAEHMLRDLMSLYKIPKRPFNIGLNLLRN